VAAMAQLPIRVVIDQDACISCGACIEVCENKALEFNEDMKARLIWDKCKDDFKCVETCPVGCIHRTPDAPQALRDKPGWYRLSRTLTPEEQMLFNEWRKTYGIKADPVSIG